MLNQTLEELALNILIEGEFDTLPIKITFGKGKSC